MECSDQDEPSYVMSADASFQFRRSDEIVVSTPRVTAVLTFDEYQAILEFRSERTISDVYESLELEIPQGEFRALVLRWSELGILSGSSAQAPDPSFLDHANRDIFCDAGVLEQIRAHLKADRLLHIPNAMNEEFAQRIYGALDASRAWRPYEAFHPFFHYKHHNMQLRSEYPDELKECMEVFCSPATKQFVGELSGRDCAGDAEFSASRYFPGDYSLPHTDRSKSRSVAYVWHLTKNWDPTWGGDLVWCPTGTSILPRFNCLTLFNLTEHSLHFVAPVATPALGKRLTVNGWWCKVTEETAARTRLPQRSATVSDAGYGPPRQRVVGREDIMVL